MYPEQTPSSASRLESWSFGILAALAFIVPLAVLPSSSAQQAVVKGLVIAFGVLAAALLYALSRFRARSFEWIAHPLSYAGAALGLVLLASAAWSGDFAKALFGQGFEYQAAAFIFLLAIAARLAAVLASRGMARALWLYAAALASFALLALFHIVRFFAPGFLSLGVFSSVTSTPVGSWFELGIFAAVALILSAFALLYLPMPRRARISASVLLAVAAFFVVVTGLSLVYWGLAFVFLGVSAYEYASRRSAGAALLKRFALLPVIALALSCAFIWKGDLVTVPFAGALGATYNEAHLPWQMTLDVGVGAVKQSPILGPGPGSFSKEYLLYKPAGVNESQFWQTQFSNGSGFVPTLAVSLGAAGFVLLVLLYAYFFRSGFALLRSGRPDDAVLAYVAYSSFFSAFFLWFMALVYDISYVSLFLAALLSGVFIGSLIASGRASVRNVSFSAAAPGRAWKRAAGMAVIVLLAAGLAWYAMGAAALGFFMRGVGALSGSQPDAALAKADFQKAVALSLRRSDTYYQGLAESDLAAMQAVVAQLSADQSAGKKLDQSKVAELGTLMNEAAGYAMSAVKLDPSNYFNYLSLARVYSVASSLRVSGAYDSAVSAYKSALAVDPYDPSIYLSLAQLAASQNDYAGATQYIGSALQLKGNYVDAVYLLAQVQVAQGKTADAVTSAKFAVQLTPNDPTAYFELGLFQYDAGLYQDAAASLGKAIALSPDYANARYFLGLADARTGDLKSALQQFRALAAQYPDNADVSSVLKSLEAGKSPFASAKPSASAPLR